MDLFVFLFLVSLVYGVYSLFELFARRKERMMIIEKMVSSSPPLDPGKLPFLQPFSFRSFGSLRAACMMLGLGTGFIASFFIMDLIPETVKNSLRHWEMQSMVMFGSVLLFGGAGMVISYIIERNTLKKDAERDSGK